MLATHSHLFLLKASVPSFACKILHIKNAMINSVIIITINLFIRKGINSFEMLFACMDFFYDYSDSDIISDEKIITWA